MKTFTIGFTQKRAEHFFGLLGENAIARIIDVRLNNVSQLAGFAKRDDLQYFLKTLCQVDYIHLKELAPTKSILDAYKKKQISWEKYEDQFLNLMAQRNIERTLEKSLLDQSCLLCSEHQPHYCHRRVLVEYLNQQWDQSIEVVHLV